MYEMGPEAAAQLLPLIAAESDIANSTAGAMMSSGHPGGRRRDGLARASVSGGGSRAAATPGAVSLSSPMQWNARTFGGVGSSGVHAGLPRVRQKYGGGFGTKPQQAII